MTLLLILNINISETRDMKLERRKFLRYSMAVGPLAYATRLSAQTWPSKPVTLIIPFATGGTVDPMTRVVGDELSKRLGQAFVYDNKSGASGNIGTLAAVRARPDGYTLLLGSVGTMVTSKFLFKNSGYDPLRDLDPVGRFAAAPFSLLTRTDLGVSSIKEFIDLAKAKPNSISVGLSGVGSSVHLALLMLEKETGAKFNSVFYRGAGQTTLDLTSGRIDATLDQPGAYVPYVKQGSLKMLGTLGATRSSLFPDSPTIVEAGFPAIPLSGWFSLMAPKGTPREVVETLNQELFEVMKRSDVREKLALMGYAPVPPQTAQELGASISTEQSRMEKVIRDANLSLD